MTNLLTVAAKVFLQIQLYIDNFAANINVFTIFQNRNF